MTHVPLDDRKETWQLLHALDCFQHVARICAFIEDHAIANGHPLYHSLLTSLFVLYGRPFKKAHGVGRLPDEVVPAELRPVHADLITHRDKIFAHTDIGGKWEEEDLNQIELTVRGGVYGWRVRTIQPMPERIAEFRSLCAVLIPIVNLQINAMNRKIAMFVPREDGAYRLVLGPAETAAFEAVQELGERDL